MRRDNLDAAKPAAAVIAVCYRMYAVMTIASAAMSSVLRSLAIYDSLSMYLQSENDALDSQATADVRRTATLISRYR